MVYVCFECGSDTKSDPDSYLVQLFLGLYSDTGFSFQGFTSVVCKVSANILVCHSASMPMITAIALIDYCEASIRTIIPPLVFRIGEGLQDFSLWKNPLALDVISLSVGHRCISLLTLPSYI